MITIRTDVDLEQAMAGALDPGLRMLLSLRRSQLPGPLHEQAHFIIVERGDSLAAVEKEAGYPLTVDAPPWDWVERHPGGWIEAPIITDDDGFAVIILARDCITTNPALLFALRAHA